jgi:cell division protein FtsX
MQDSRLAFQLGIGTLRSRPTLTVLAVGLLALGTAVMGGLVGTLYLLHSLQGEFVSALSLEIELTGDSEQIRAAVMSQAEAWPGAESVQYVPPELTLREIERETGEDLQTLFGTNPFPSLVRVRFRAASVRFLDSLAAIAQRWPEVSAVVYPRRLWSDLQTLADRLRGGLGLSAALFTLVVVGLVGLCLRAQVRNRAATWEFLMLSGASRNLLGLTLLIQEIAVGLAGGLAACGILILLSMVYRWLFLRNVTFPLWFFAVVGLLALLLSVMAGLLSPRRFARG